MKNLLSLLIILSPFFLHAQEKDMCSVSKIAIEHSVQIRELKLLKEVPCLVKDKEDVKKYLIKTIEEKIPVSKLANEEILYKALSIIPKNFKYKDGIIDLYLSQLGGYYDPIKNHYIMAGWMPKMLQMPIAVHELVHALQDQHYNLDNFLDNLNLTSDEVLARSALVEGDASYIMYEYVYKQSGQKSLSESKDVSSIIFQVVASMAANEDLKKVPNSLQAMLIFPYTSGLRFAHHLIKQGGINEINKVYKRLPTTTKEILHPEVYLSGYRHKPISLNEFSTFLEFKESQVIYSDSIGEFGLASIFSNNLETKLNSADLAKNWAGDLAIILESQNGKKVYWLLKLESDDQATITLENLKKIKDFKFKNFKIENSFLFFDFS